MHPLKYGHLVFFNMHYIKETPHYINSLITDLILGRFLYKHEFSICDLRRFLNIFEGINATMRLAVKV